MPFAELPTEILHLICSHLTPDSLSSFRLAYKKAAAVGIDYLAQEVTLVPTPDSISRLLTLSSHPILRTNVKMIDLSCWLYPRFEDDYDTREHVEQTLRDSSSPEYSKELPIYYAYNSLCDSQLALIKSKHYWSSLLTILSRLCNLRKIAITGSITRELIPRHLAPTSAAKTWAERFVGESRTGQWSWQVKFARKVLGFVLVKMNSFISKNEIRRFQLHYSYLPYGLYDSRFLAWKAGLERLTCISLGREVPCDDRGLEIHHSHDLNSDDEEIDNGEYDDEETSDSEDSGESVRDEDEEIDNGEYDDEETSDNEESGENDRGEDEKIHDIDSPMNLFIAGARNVEEIFVDLGDEEVIGSIDVLKPDAHWPYLRILTLYNVPLLEDHMLEFFERHGSTLEVLQLSRVSLCRNRSAVESGTAEWINFLQRARSESLFILTSFGSSNIPCLDIGEGFEWTDVFPNLIPPARAIRYLMCGKKTGMRGEVDRVSLQSYDWKSLSWGSVGRLHSAAVRGKNAHRAKSLAY